jgi:phospholipid/cholesterol/gamma-HCH transport system permease protein
MSEKAGPDSGGPQPAVAGSEEPRSPPGAPGKPQPLLAALAGLGGRTLSGFAFVGGLGYLLADAIRGTLAGLFRRRMWAGTFSQMVRVGVKSIGIIVLVQAFIGIILTLQMAPVLRNYGQVNKVADIVSIAQFRELGPLLTAIVLSGFAGASIAAELGTMVVSEEIEAMRATALDPVRFLVVPRVLATLVMTVCLTVLADVVGVGGGLLTAWQALGISPGVYKEAAVGALAMLDFTTGLIKAGIFGTLISLIACFEGLRVTGGAAGVGRATTRTVVLSIVALIGADCVFTAVFYAYGW